MALLLAGLGSRQALANYVVSHTSTINPQQIDWASTHTLPQTPAFYDGDPEFPLISITLAWTLGGDSFVRFFDSENFLTFGSLPGTWNPIDGPTSHPGDSQNNNITIQVRAGLTFLSVPDSSTLPTLYLSDLDASLSNLGLPFLFSQGESVPAYTVFEDTLLLPDQSDSTVILATDPAASAFIGAGDFDVDVAAFARGRVIGTTGNENFQIITQLGSELTVTYVYLPEASTWTAVGACVVGMGGILWRRRRSAR